MRIATLVVAIAALAVAAHAATPAKTPARPSGLFDVRDPASLITLLKTMDAKAEVARTEAAAVFLNVTTPGGDFGAQYVDCDAKGKACRAFLSDDGKPNLAYATLVNLRMTAEEVKQHVGVWQGCLGSFGAFTKKVGD